MFRQVVSGSQTALQASKAIDKEMVKLLGIVETNMPAILNEVGKEVLNDTIPITPKKTGALRNSAKYRVFKNQGKYTLRVSFGGTAPSFPQIKDDQTGRISGTVDYAIDRHEIRAKIYGTPGTGWKYLYTGANKTVARSEEIIGRALMRLIK